MKLAQNLSNIQSQAFGTNQIPGTLGELIGKLLPYIFGAAGIALLIYLVLGGFQMMTSRGDPKAMQAAQAKITYALIGFLIIVTAYLIVLLIGQLLNINVFNVIFSNVAPGQNGPLTH